MQEIFDQVGEYEAQEEQSFKHGNEILEEARTCERVKAYDRVHYQMD